MPLSTSLALILMAGSSIAAPQSFDLSSGSATRQTPYQAGGLGMEPGSTDDDFLFSVAVPDGTYRVTLKLGDRKAAGETTVKAEARRLMLRNVATRKGQFVERQFLVNVRSPALPPPPANAPGGTAVRITAGDAREYTWDDRLTLEFLGKPQVTSVTIEPVSAPTIFLAGDSTVTDQAAEPAASWGQMLPAMLDGGVAVANHAKSGATLKSFLTDLRFDKLLSAVKPGDWLFIQFGHNDQKQEWPQTYADTATTYPAYLRAYIAEARRRGAHAVLVTSPERRNFDESGRIKDTLGSYADAMRKLAAEERVPLIDLNADSRAIYEALGPQIAPTAFNDGGRDKTHHDNYGAWLLASAVAERIRTQIPELAPHIVAAPFMPAQPPSAAQVAIVPSRAHSDVRPAGN
ncbi:Lysophospholipase L1-like esterase precursor [Sphingobium yanoikuyae]|uniref:Lysophospholipase L1-like esterase n=1 Tax=Sphingobium yanoikuyae TaxID=13690 RepID=A0A084ELN2_SPHYA|nr:rhamnogalacturonan acetylesterase [Sphingobium yanoikuyae]KEZ18874.1 Lysophospholipase L1-like esterase precursor [Sphingobium yanoikuyae]